MKVSKAISAAVLAAVAVGGSAGAFAAVDPTNGQSDLFVAVWNPTTSTSYVEDLTDTPYSALGSSSTFNSSSGYSQSWNLDNGSLDSVLGSGTYQYQVFAADYFTSPNTYEGTSAYLSLVAGASIPTGLLNGDLVNNAIANNGAISKYIINNLPGSTTSVVGTGNTYWAATPSGPGVNDSFQINGLTFLGGTSQGNALNLIYYVAGAPDNSNGPVTGTAVGNSANRGIFNLSADGVLSYSLSPEQVTSPVPLPPAGWLLISGLLGLVAVSRRRDAEAL